MSELLVGSAPQQANLHPQALDTGYAPVDEFGMPYLIHPYDAPHRFYDEWKDDDHSFYRRNAPELNELGGQSVRVCRVQNIQRWLHNNKHYAFSEGVVRLPQTDGEKFALTVLACAGYVSRTALDLRDRSDPKYVTMSKRTYDFVRGKKQLYFEQRRNYNLGYKTQENATKKIGLFFADYIKEHGLEGVVDEKIVDEFIHTSNERKRRKLGNKILGHAMNTAIEPVTPLYMEALSEGALRPTKRHPARVVLEIFPVSKWPDYHDSIKEALAA